jgi:predicted DsbA family dithiol-disulfide isomerase
MKVEIWSDVMCPFCYIGKRRFEAALARFAHKDKIGITWKSFQLNPSLKTNGNQNVNDYLAEAKGWSPDYARQMNDRVTQMAAEEGLEYHMDNAVVANSFDAHRIIQFAKTHNKADAVEEALFRAYFTDGKNTADQNTLLELAIAAGLDAAEITNVLKTDAFAAEVEHDIYEAQQIGVRGVPYFVFNDRYAVSGAQASETFLGALNQSWNEYAQSNDFELQQENKVSNTCEPGTDCS